MKRAKQVIHPITLLAVLLLVTAATEAHAGRSDSERPHGLVGLRPLPATLEQTKHNHGGSWEGVPTFDKQKGQYPFVAEHMDVLFGWVPGGDFKTKRVFFEYYWGLSKARDVLDPHKNTLIKQIKQWEDRGGEVVHILICREARLAVNRGWPDAELGPFKEDGRILSAEDVADIRAMFKQAHGLGLTKHADYNLIQMVEEPSFFATDAEAQAVVKQMQGIAYEAHQFNRHWPLETGWSRPGPVIEGATWALEQGLDYVFYFGPIVWHGPRYYPYIERMWLYKYWAAGLPKRHPKMHYYLNTFPHGSGRGRPVGPESDPHAILGFAKWLIGEVKGERPAEDPG
ncbi:MAG: hypothetical protein ACE37H_15255 [Phycisphaeraceae bacterium]